MITFILGTRGEFLKIAPVMIECQNRGIEWQWVFTAQHKTDIDNIIKYFEIPKPSYTLVKWDTEADTVPKTIKWFLSILIKIPNAKKILGGFTGKENIVVVHGDTISTVLGALIGRFARCHVAHVESGLRSYNLFEPFPEEISRLIVFRLANIFLCPGQWAYDNLIKFGIKKERIFNVGRNTQIDTLKIGLEKCDNSEFQLPENKYCLSNLHRYENFYKEDRATKVIDLVVKISQNINFVFIMHPNIKIQLEKYNLIKNLQSKNIKIVEYLDYLSFIKAAKHCEFMVTDGGGNQEELSYMGKPTLILRESTERTEGLGENALLSYLDEQKVIDFINNYKKYKRKSVKDYVSPSKLIVDHLINIIKAK